MFTKRKCNNGEGDQIDLNIRTADMIEYHGTIAADSSKDDRTKEGHLDGEELKTKRPQRTTTTEGTEPGQQVKHERKMGRIHWRKRGQRKHSSHIEEIVRKVSVNGRKLGEAERWTSQAQGVRRNGWLSEIK